MSFQNKGAKSTVIENKSGQPDSAKLSKNQKKRLAREKREEEEKNNNIINNNVPIKKSYEFSDPGLMIKSKIDATQMQLKNVTQQLRKLEELPYQERISVMTPWSMSALKTVLAPELEVPCRIPDSGRATAVLPDKTDFAVNPDTYVADNAGIKDLEVVFSPSSMFQYFTNFCDNGTALGCDQNRMSHLARTSQHGLKNTISSGVAVCQLPDTGIVFTESAEYFPCQYNFINTKSDLLHFECADFQGVIMKFYDINKNIIHPFDGIGNPYPDDEVPFTGALIKVQYAGPSMGVDDVDATSQVWLPVDSVAYVQYLFNPSARRNTRHIGVAAVASKVNNVGIVGPLHNYHDKSKGANAFIGVYHPAVSTALSPNGQTNNAAVLMRVAGSNLLCHFNGGSQTNGSIVARTFEDSVSIPAGISTVSYLGSKTRSFTGDLQNGVRPWYIPAASTRWTDCAQTVQNNPWTGAYETIPFYQWATRIYFKPTDNSGFSPPTVPLMFSSAMILEIVSSARNYDYSAAPYDPYWGVTHAELVRVYQITCNPDHKSWISKAFDTVKKNVLTVGHSLLTNKALQSAAISLAEMGGTALLALI